MNAWEINGGSFSLGFELAILCMSPSPILVLCYALLTSDTAVPVSVGIVLVAIIFAFSSTARSLSLFLVESVVYIFAHTPFYHAWRHAGRQVQNSSERGRRRMEQDMKTLVRRHDRAKRHKLPLKSTVGSHIADDSRRKEVYHV